MSGPSDPPDGTPESVSGGDDEYRSVVFDESFVRAARLQELSAQERVGDHAPAVRSRRPWRRKEKSGASPQAVIVIMLIALAFATAVYMGVQRPYEQTATRAADPLRSTLVPLAPRGQVPGGPAASLYAHSPAKKFRIGADGITLPPAQRTAHFSQDQVGEALTTAKEFLVHSALDPDTLAGGDARLVRLLIDPDQLGQFDASMARPSDDGQHAATGWVLRFDPARVSLADEPVRVQGRLTVSEVNGSALEVVADHTYVYALRRAAKGAPKPADGPADTKPTGPAGTPDAGRTGAGTPGGSPASAPTGTAPTGGARLPTPVAVPGTGPHSLFTVRRAARFRFDRDDLRDHHLEVVESALQAGPQTCAADASDHLQPLFAGERAPSDAAAGTNPYATGRPTDSLCGVLAPGAQPSGVGSR
ncbi:hypothetical protein ACMA1D_02860 [Streptomyces sp. 796.1]|uniref:SCO2583 family membrane protein n=1 Tax=Streptomyces sp. 796.1 TaxID=3163029 RepID=UPI0039C8E99F